MLISDIQAHITEIRLTSIRKTTTFYS